MNLLISMYCAPLSSFGFGKSGLLFDLSVSMYVFAQSVWWIFKRFHWPCCFNTMRIDSIENCWHCDAIHPIENRFWFARRSHSMYGNFPFSLLSNDVLLIYAIIDINNKLQRFFSSPRFAAVIPFDVIVKWILESYNIFYRLPSLSLPLPHLLSSFSIFFHSLSFSLSLSTLSLQPDFLLFLCV